MWSRNATKSARTLCFCAISYHKNNVIPAECQEVRPCKLKTRIMRPSEARISKYFLRYVFKVLDKGLNREYIERYKGIYRGKRGIMADQTVKQWLEELAGNDSSSEKDASMMQNLLHRVGFGRAVVVYGIVYLEGQGTIEAPPASIHSVASMLLKA